jgi:polysaccharide pyruvyl transferase WcaK-like protein
MSGRVLVLHAYDARNRGDALLVRESLDYVHRAGVPKDDVRLVALVASGFETAGEVVQYPQWRSPAGSVSRGAVTVAALSLASVALPQGVHRMWLQDEVRSSALIVGVGGAYLQARGGLRSVNTMLTHAPQLALAARSGRPSVYLPQSIGPLRGAIGASIRRNLRSLTQVMVRDDRSLLEVPAGNAMRVPDLAVLAIGRALKAGAIDVKRSGGRILGLARYLQDAPLYPDRLAALHRLVEIDWAVHSTAEGQDDAAFYAGRALPTIGGSETPISSGDFGACISVRLHGALQSILAGIPTIHLSYERKGYGAFGDLGLLPWVHNANGFDPAAVAEQARELVRDPSAYWAGLQGQLPALVEADLVVVRTLRRHL